MRIRRIAMAPGEDLLRDTVQDWAQESAPVTAPSPKDARIKRAMDTGGYIRGDRVTIKSFAYSGHNVARIIEVAKQCFEDSGRLAYELIGAGWTVEQLSGYEEVQSYIGFNTDYLKSTVDIIMNRSDNQLWAALMKDLKKLGVKT